jgi:hypothetical protein
MGDYGNYARDLFRAAGFIYIAICLAAFALALWLPKRWWGKLIAACIVIGLASILPLQARKELDQDQAKADEFKQRYDKAKALFDERCKTAGEKIYRTVDGVEGIRLINLRPEKISTSGQFALDDQYGHDVGGLGYIASFLRPTEQMDLARNAPELKVPGYRVIETAEGDEVKHYTKSFKLHPNGHPYPSTQETKASKFKARYALRYEDISTRQDRENWIAGGAIRILDQQTNEIVAERVGFLFDRGLGSTNGERSPWSWARTYVPGCPTANEHNQIFAFKVLKPISGE